MSEEHWRHHFSPMVPAWKRAELEKIAMDDDDLSRLCDEWAAENPDECGGISIRYRLLKDGVPIPEENNDG